MAAIKVQSIGDIITAYLETLGMSRDDDRLEFFVKELHASLGDLTGKEKDIVSLLDGVLCQKAQKIFDDLPAAPAQAAAIYKFCFLESGGFKLWGKEFLHPENSETFKKALREKNVVTAPRYVLSRMQAQKIESIAPKNILHKIMAHKGK